MNKLQSMTSVAALLAFSLTGASAVSYAEIVDNSAPTTAKVADAKCGEAKCGAAKKAAHAKRAAEAKCGAAKKMADAKCGAAH